MDILLAKKKIEKLEEEFAKELKTLTNEIGCSVKEVYVHCYESKSVGKKEPDVVFYDVKIKVQL